MNTLVKTPGVGIAALIVDRHKVLVGRRNKPPMRGSWQLPGGWLDYGDTPERALAERIGQFPGMRVGRARFVAITDNHFADGLHTISLYYRLTCVNPEAVDTGLNGSCDEWRWADWDTLPAPLFLPLELLKCSGFDL